MPNEGSTVIGKSIIVRGELSGSEDLFLDGDLEGSIKVPENRLTLGPNARVVANLHVRDLVVLGNLKGNVRASGRVELRQSAAVNGDIIAARLSIEDNAAIKGKVELISSSTAAPAPSSEKTPASTTSTAAPAAPFALEPKA